MTAADDEGARRAGRARAVALFRYSLIREAADPGLSTRQRGRLVRELAAREHAGSFGEPVRVSRPSLDRWIRAWRSGGFDALAPPARQVTPRTPAEVLALPAALKRENPGRTAAQVARILRASGGWSPSERTLQRHFVRLELTAHILEPAQLEAIRMLTLCRDRDYAGDLHEVPVPQPVCGQPPGIIPVGFR